MDRDKGEGQGIVTGARTGARTRAMITLILTLTLPHPSPNPSSNLIPNFQSRKGVGVEIQYGIFAGSLQEVCRKSAGSLQEAKLWCRKGVQEGCAGRGFLYYGLQEVLQEGVPAIAGRGPCEVSAIWATSG